MLVLVAMLCVALSGWSCSGRQSGPVCTPLGCVGGGSAASSVSIDAGRLLRIWPQRSARVCWCVRRAASVEERRLC